MADRQRHGAKKLSIETKSVVMHKPKKQSATTEFEGLNLYSELRHITPFSAAAPPAQSAGKLCYVAELYSELFDLH